MSDPAEWVDRHGDALYRYALLRVRNPERAEEMVQECLLAALDTRTQLLRQLIGDRLDLLGTAELLTHVHQSHFGQ